MGGRHTRNDGQKVVPTATNSASMLLDELPHGDAQLLLYSYRVVDVAADAEQLGAVVVLAAEAGEPLRAPPQDCGGNSYCFDVCHGGGASQRPTLAGKGGLRRGLPALPSKLSIRAVSSPASAQTFYQKMHFHEAMPKLFACFTLSRNQYRIVLPIHFCTVVYVCLVFVCLVNLRHHCP